ncbi:MAG: long-chain fatty acid--CoA ligase [Proteobacteria bacterium]|nr:long-chain fatty acid--CoA ligase [Pseudomonadota bacterium]
MFDYANCPNLVRMFLDIAESKGEAPFLHACRDGRWVSWSWARAASEMRLMARGLAALGVKRGDRIALVAENRPEWLIADFAIMAAGAITVPAYTTNTVEDHRHIFANVSAKGVIASTAALAQKSIEAARHVGPACGFVVAMEPPAMAQHPGVDVHAWADVRARGSAAPDDVDATVASLTRKDVACIIHTSGTGGLPRGVMLHHGAILHNSFGAWDVLQALPPGPETCLSFLPLSHSYEHMVCMGFMTSIGAEIWFAESIERLGPNMAEVRPTIMTAVPRLYESLHQRITGGLKREKKLKQWLFAKTLELGTKRYEGRKLGPLEKLLDAVLEKLVRDKVRARFGGRLKAFVSGGAALNPEIGVFFQALGVRVVQGYGQTESAPVIACNRPYRERMETVGRPLLGVDVKLGPDGEILVRGELVMTGYWNDPEGTARTVVDGWLHTGDVGEIDAEGRIKITDRKKDFIKNSGGDMVAPAKVEGTLLLEPEIAQTMVTGDGRPYLVALVVPHADTIAAAGGDANALRATVEKAIERANAKLALPERIRKFALAGEPFTIENAQLTPTMKIRRHIIRQSYGDALEGLYR